MRFDDQRGMVLYSSLLILSLLVAVGVGARVMLQSDFKLLANMRASMEAFYVADAGIEWSKDEIRKNFNHPPILPSRAQSFSSGNFSVSFLSPTAVTSLVARIVVRSTGAVGSSSQVVQAQVTKTYDLADGAVSLRLLSGLPMGFAVRPKPLRLWFRLMECCSWQAKHGELGLHRSYGALKGLPGRGIP